MNHIHSLYSCSVPGCTDYPMLVVTANMRDDSVSFRKKYTDQLGGTSVMVPMETGGEALAAMLETTYSGPSFWIEPNRHFTNIIAGGGWHDIMTDSLIELHNLQAHEHTALIEPEKMLLSAGTAPNIKTLGSTIEITGVSGSAKIELFSLNGQLLKEYQIKGATTLTMSSVKTGTFVVRLKSSEGTFSKIIVKNE